jgi:hypothetical protein
MVNGVRLSIDDDSEDPKEPSCFNSKGKNIKFSYYLTKKRIEFLKFPQGYNVKRN